ncbi:MAG: hypothetical protein KJ939_07060 [Nanoarchaeota archaeon]|nr:hypothetical protein [Nanoarchaeota archaeon]
MTTVTCTYTQEPGVPKTGLFLFTALIVAIVTAIWAVPQHTAPRVVAIAVPPIVYEKHAEKHADALALRQCLNDKGGAAEIWRSFDKKYF